MKAGDKTPTFEFALVQEEPPPPDAFRKGVWEEELRPLMEHPGVWYRVREAKSKEAARTIAASLTRKETRRPDGEWTFRCGVSKTDGKPYVYARYDGEVAKPVAPRARRPAGPPSFRQWLVQQAERKDAVGELSRYAIKASDWPTHGPMDKGRLEGYIDKKGAPMSQWFVPAWAEYESVAGNGG